MQTKLNKQKKLSGKKNTNKPAFSFDVVFSWPFTADMGSLIGKEKKYSQVPSQVPKKDPKGCIPNPRTSELPAHWDEEEAKVHSTHQHPLPSLSSLHSTMVSLSAWPPSMQGLGTVLTPLFPSPPTTSLESPWPHLLSISKHHPSSPSPSSHGLHSSPL